MDNNEISQDDLKSYFENAQQINSSNMLIIELENRRNLIIQIKSNQNQNDSLLNKTDLHKK